jgi:hypothetical protein
LRGLRNTLSPSVHMADLDADPRLESVRCLLDEERFEEAGARAEATLAGLPASADPLLLGSLQLVIIQAEMGRGRRTQAVGLRCREALALVRGQQHVEAEVRLCALELGLELPEFGNDARDSTVWLNERRHSLRPSQLARLIVLETVASRLMGVEHEACEVLRRGIDELAGTPEQRIIRLEHARARLVNGELVEKLDELLLEVIDRDSSRREIALVEAIVWDHHGKLGDPIVVRTLEWARDRSPNLCGFVLARRGQVDEALETLRRGVRAAAGKVRDGCAHVLLELLPDDAVAERLRCAEQLEAALDRDDNPATRHDVAVAMSIVARVNKDPGLMERALGNARRAAVGLASTGEHVGHELVVGLLAELIEMRSSRPTADLAQLARQLVVPAPSVPAELLGQARALAAHWLTLMGPICHPQVLAVAQTLVELAQVDMPEHGELDLLRARCRWLRDLQQGTSVEPGNGPKGLLDDAPQWLINLTGGASVRVLPDELQKALGQITMVVDARPDVADHLLACLLQAWESARGPWVAQLEVVLANCVELAPHTGQDAWPELRAALDDALSRDDRPWLRTLSTTVSRARREDVGVDASPRQGSASASERAHALLVQGRRFSDLARDPRSSERAANSARAIDLMRAALEAAREAGDSCMEFHVQVGLGNALQWGPEPDLEAAFNCYAAAEGLDVDDDQALAKLWKVKGDALVERGRDEDLRQAEAMIGRSLTLRTGRLRAETLLSASTVAERHPDLDNEQRLLRSINFLMDAVRADRDVGQAAVPHLCKQLVELRRVSPGNHGVNERLAELERRHPEHRVHIERARHGVGDQVVAGFAETVAHAMTDPDTSFVFRLKSLLIDPDEQIAQMPSHILAQVSRADIRKRLAEHCIRGQPTRVDAELSRLRGETKSEAAVGRLVGEVLLLAELVRLGCREAAETRRATTTARDAIRTSASPQTRAALLFMLAELWHPRDPSNTPPTSDIDLSRELASEAVDAGRGEQHANPDVIVLLARSHRYARTGDRNQHLRTARDIYARLHERARTAGDGDLAALALHHQVDAEMEMAVGDRGERLRDGIRKLQFAVNLARAPGRVAEIQISIAWYMTTLANFVSEDEQLAILDEALALFDAVDRSAAPPICNLDNLRGICEAARIRLRAGPEVQIEIWETKLADPSLSSYDRAIFQHNLAIRLRRSTTVTAAQVLRAIEMFEAAALVREPVSARHGWETCFEAGLMIVQALLSDSGLAPELLPWGPQESITRARDWLQRAIAAATQLGRGEELADAALVLAWLATAVPELELASELAEQAWSALRQTTPYLVSSGNQRAREASLARQLALRFTALSLDDGVVGVGTGSVRALGTSAGELVVRWLLRAQASARRPLVARIERPRTASATWWSSWQRALDDRNGAELNTLLEQVHTQEPDYLTGEPSLDETWRWLEAESDSVAIAVVLAPSMAVCVLLNVGEDGKRWTRVLSLPAGTPPGDEEQLVKLVEPMIHGGPAALSIHASMVEWARQSIVAPILEFLGLAPKTVLWCPGPVLRLVAPSALWAGVPVACTHSLALPRLDVKPRPRSSLIAAAIPRKDVLVKEVSRAVQSLVAEASRMGPVRILVSAGEAHGKRVFDRETVRDTPASAADLLAEAPSHDLVVLIAHGRAGAEDRTTLACVKADGSIDRLTGSDLAKHRDAFTGATVILMSCESGRIGGYQHAPDGIAGALISAGAFAVIAPLWSVYLSVAGQVAGAVVRGLSRTRSPWKVLAELPATILAGGPVLDEPTSEQRHEGRRVQRQSFVVWLG